jgi:hypothetical protein
MSPQMPQRAVMNRTLPMRASLRPKIAAVLACAAAASPYIANAVPVIPQGGGYGLETPAGRGGKVFKVINLNPSGAGSLKACVDASGPRVCVFEVSGTIHAKEDLIIRNPNITIAGQTAPSPGVLWRGGALWVAASDVLVQHMRFRPGDDPDGPAYENRDALKIVSPTAVVRNIVIDHCSFSWAVDETVQLWTNWDDVTISNNIISEGLHESFSPLGTGGYGLLLGPWKGKASISGNLLAHNYARNPLSRASQMVFVNNVVYGAGAMNVDLQSEGLSTNNTIIGNVFMRAPTSGSAKPVHIRNTGNWPVPSTSKVYVTDNNAVEATDDPWSVVEASSGTVPKTMKSELPPTWPAGLTRLPTSDGVTLNQVLKRVGARPADRDPVDKRIIQQVKSRTGQIINCVAPNGTTRCSKNAGGWPVMAENRRALTLPKDPDTVAASGYTNLELWLHEMAAQVEGRSNRQPTPPVLASDK